jgi:hypothetical protein
MLSAMPNLSSKQKKEAKCMIGALVPSGPGQVLIAVSGVGVRAAFTQAALLMPKAFVCGPVDPPVTTRGGRAITPGELSAMKVDNEPLQCAAPKLIMEARKRNYRMPWDMTEIWFDAQMNERHKHKAVGYTKHGWSIASCATCTNVVPALMCTLAS